MQPNGLRKAWLTWIQIKIYRSTFRKMPMSVEEHLPKRKAWIFFKTSVRQLSSKKDTQLTVVMWEANNFDPGEFFCFVLWNIFISVWKIITSKNKARGLKKECKNVALLKNKNKYFKTKTFFVKGLKFCLQLQLCMNLFFTIRTVDFTGKARVTAFTLTQLLPPMQ